MIIIDRSLLKPHANKTIPDRASARLRLIVNDAKCDVASAEDDHAEDWAPMAW
jgi:hypothetical protein